MRSRISRAARSVKVMAVNWSSRAGRRPARVQAGEESLGQDEGLAAARPGRQRDGNAARGDRPLLLLGQSCARGGCHVFSKERT